MVMNLLDAKFYILAHVFVFVAVFVFVVINEKVKK